MGKVIGHAFPTLVAKVVNKDKSEFNVRDFFLFKDTVVNKV